MGKTKKIVQTVKRLLIRFLMTVIKPYILFESRPPFSDNTRAVYDEFLRRGFDKKYRLVWYLDDNTCADLINGKPVYWDPRDRNSLRQKIRNIGFYFNTKAIICCNRFLTSSGWACPVEQGTCKSFYLSHGTPIKKVEGYYSAPSGIDYAFSPSANVTGIMSAAFKIDSSRYLVSGYPRTDLLFQDHGDLHDRICQGSEKVIVWLPTFRQHQKKTVSPAGGYAMPLIHEAAYAEQLNETAMKNNVLLVFKPHFVQDRSFLNEINLSNIQFADESFFERFDISTYDLLAASDALITDYSSVYFDYTLLDKPIAVVWEDVEEYRKNPGFVVDLDRYLVGAEKVYSIKDLCEFVENVAKGSDLLKTERREIRDLTNDNLDGRNSKRAVDFIIEKADL